MFKKLGIFLNKSIRRHLIIGIVATHAILMSIFIYDMTSNQEDFLKKESIYQTKSLAQTLSKNAVSWVLSNDYVGMEEIIESIKNYPHIKYAMLLDFEGKVLAHTEEIFLNLYIEDKISQQILTATKQIILIHDSKIIDVATPITTNNKIIGWARVAIDQTHIKDGTSYITNKGIFYALIAILIGWLFALFMAKKLTNSIFHITEIINNISNGNWGKRLTIKRNDELGTLMLQFNIMLDKLQQKDIQIKQINESLKESEFRWKFAVDGNGAGLWDWNIITNEVYFSTQWKKMLGFEDNEIENLLSEWENRVHPDDLESTYDDIMKHINGETDFYQNEHRILCKDGTYKWILDRGVIVQRDDKNEPTRMIGTHIDISEIKTLKENNRKLDLASSSAHIGIWTWNIKENTLVWDKEMYSIYDIDTSKSYLLYDIWKNALHKDDAQRAENELISSMENKTNFNTVFKIKTITGVIKYIKASGVTTYDKNGDPISMIGTNQDVTKEELLKISLENEKQNAIKAYKAKSEFLANMSHEIRTPLSGILGITEIMLEEDCTDSQREYLQIIKNSSFTLKNIINDVLDFSKIQAGKFEIIQKEFSLIEMLNDLKNLFNPLISHKNLEFSIENNVDSNFNYLIGDSLRITQILNNLVGNSIKFTDNGFIRLKISLKNRNHNKVKLLFEIKDSGIGMSEKIQKSIFEAFTQGELSNTKNFQGTGLGLTISKSLVELMNGNIWFESKENKGTTFYFEIEFKVLKELKNKKATSIDNNKKLLAEEKVVLVAEDSEVNQIVTKKILENLGFKVVIANNGEEALEKVSKDTYDLIFMDLQMPIMDGYEATKKIREFDNKTPIIALSAAVFNEDIQKTAEIGMNDHIAKPIDKIKFLEVISKYFKFINIHNINSEEINNKSHIKIYGLNIEELFQTTGLDENGIYLLIDKFANNNLDLIKVLPTLDLESIQLKEIIHKLKGSSGNLKMNKIHNLCKDIELSDIQNRPKLIYQLVLELKNIIDNIKLNITPLIKKEKILKDEELKSLISEIIEILEDFRFLEDNKINLLKDSISNIVDESVMNDIQKNFDIGENEALVKILKGLKI